MQKNKPIFCIAVDDEPPALRIIEKYILAVPALKLVGTCANAVEALELLQQKPIDLLFLDIQMPHIIGTEFMRTIQNPPKVIFTTAFRKFALEGFDLDAVDYLLKPISFERFLKAVNKVMKFTATANLPAILDTGQIPTEQRPKQPEYILLRADRKNTKVNLNELLFIESLNDYVKVVTRDKIIMSKIPITTLEESLPPSFIRIHRSFIVSISKIESFTPEMIQIEKYELPVSRSYRHEVERALKNGL